MENNKKSEHPEKPTPPAWYYSTTSLIVSFICIGPLMLPLVWMHPHMDRQKKVIFTIAILIITLLLSWATALSVAKIIEYYKFADI